MEPSIDTPNPSVIGSKGLVFVGDKIIVYRRDTNTDLHPLELDLPGGGVDSGESPFEAFRREVKEEFGLDIPRQSITYSRKYPSVLQPGTFGYYIVAKLPPEMANHITFGNEGVEYMLMTPDQYLARDDAWSVFQDRTRDYLHLLVAEK